MIVFFFLVSMTALAQSFEGRITYANQYKSKMAGATDQQFTAIMGNTQDYFIRGGNYKSDLNGTFYQWQLYVNADNKLYSKVANSTTLIWSDGAVNSDSVISAEIHRNVMEVLGYRCDELILKCKSGVQKYYFNTKLSVDPALYEKHKYGNWFEFVSRSKSLPLKSIIDNQQFTLTSVAVSVKEMKLDSAFFTLPPNAKTVKSAY